MPGQAIFDRLVGDPIWAAILLSGGFGSGKSYGLAMAVLKLCAINRGGYSGLVSPTYKMMNRSLLPTLIAICRDNRIPFVYKKSDEFIWICWDGDTEHTRGEEDMRSGASVIQLCSAEEPDSIKGPNWSHVGLDEPGLMKKEAFLFALSRLRDMSAQCRQALLAGTPEDIFDCPWLPEMFVEPATRYPGYGVVHASTRDAVERGTLPQDFLDKLSDAFPEEMQQAYIDGQFIPFKSGTVYSSFNFRLHVIDDNLEVNDQLPIRLGMDFNVNPICGTICQDHRVERGIRSQIALDEIRLERSNTFEFVKEFRRRYPPSRYRAGLHVYGDASSKATHTSATTTDYQILLDGLSDYVNFGMRIPKSNPGEWDRVQVVNTAFEKRWITVHKRCEFLTRDLVRVPKKKGVNAIDKGKDDSLTHMSDALGYLLWALLAPALQNSGGRKLIYTGRQRKLAGGRQWDLVGSRR